MPKKQWTDEERKAFGEKMRQARLTKDTHSTYPPEKEKTQEPTQANSDNADIGELLARLKELEKQLSQPKTGPTVTGGSLIGTVERYVTDKKYYPDPRTRLANEARLQRFGIFGGPITDFRFELDFEVGLSSYKTIDGINTREPKFTLKLVRVVEDEDTGEATDKRYVASQMIFHEDPDTALSIAQDNGIDVQAMGEKEFLDEMRYLRMRDWLTECFYPPAIPKAQDRREVVMGNRLVEVYTVSSESPQTFDTLTKKL